MIDNNRCTTLLYIYLIRNVFQFIIYSFLDYRLGRFAVDRGEVKLHYEHSLEGIHFGVVAVVVAEVT